ncbi:LacI family transcriptional regulator [Rahnella sp. Lac-M11]|jgi:DNA-binding LacI/PurR family transcriptional regulator|uniref:LacI family transcriptional regulator n=1 Tax=Rahnella contaminans TaxID=2703882 RepID=A0A6M2B7F4_9GAMM|nr:MULTISPECIES: LacI family DNA-binding transcriptional regulator [Rahnella]MBU9819076.1 LacI family DNA-binding transcriptional regulator [Rahnella sp. BCC 1045]MCS3425629.1 DNA-binding LacI/PurR family transcriptional regulator [Rahnella sp. BIGb0603]NGX89048.1 LacI family transcriptional regulator [Rahnella contaminans]
MANINDVSRLAKVSKATVSRVLSGSRGVKEESRLAVMQAVETLQYKPSVIAQSLSTQSTGCIGVICAAENINQSTGYLHALEKELRLNQKYLLLRFATDAAGLAHSVNEIGRGLCDAMIVIGARFELPPLPENVITIDCLDEDSDRSIHFDRSFAAETACQYVLQQGRRQIALINAENGETAGQILQGYHQALEKFLLPYDRRLVHSGEQALTQLLAQNVPFNALLVPDDASAQDALRQLAQHGRAVPASVMVFSLDSTLPPGISAVPAITYPLETLAQTAMALLAGQFSANAGAPVRGQLSIPF